MKHNNLPRISVAALVCTGLIACGGGEKQNPPSTHETPEAHLLKSGSAQAFEASLKSYLLNRPKTSMFGEGNGMAMLVQGDVAPAAGSFGDSGTTPPWSSVAGTASVSTTNTIEVGVDESDHLKTDGKYLYVVKGGRYNDGMYDVVPMDVSTASTSAMHHAAVINPAPPKNTAPQVEIYELDPANAGAKLVNTITLDDTQTISGIYLNTGTNDVKQLLVVGGQYRADGQYSGQNVTQVFAYDISQPAQASAAWNFEIEGDNNTTRLLNNRIYLVTRKTFYLPNYDYWATDEKAAAANAEAVANLIIDDVLPKTKINNESKSVVTADNCAVPTSTDTQSYFDMGLTSIVSINLSDPTQTQAFCTLENGNDVYVSTKALYLTKMAYDGNIGYTIVHKLLINNAGIEYRASGSVHGIIGWRNTAFRLNEYNDNLRLITTEYRYGIRSNSEKHQLFVLSEDSEKPNHLKIVAQLPNEQHPEAIGKPNEQLYGARFFGDYAYAVTFQRTDPLYVFNLIDPAEPFIAGKLELPGYSDYLHPLDGNTLLGIGKDAQTQNGTTLLQGIKIGLFDITDKAKPTLLNEILLGKRGSETPALHDYKALTILKSAQENRWRLAVPVSVHDGANTSDNVDSHVPFSYCGLALYEIKTNADKNALELSASGTLKLPRSDTHSWYSCVLQRARSAFVDDAVYFTESDNVWSALWSAADTLIANSPRAIQVKQWVDNKAKWQSKNAIAYDFTYQRQGIFYAEILKPFNVTVEDGVVSQIRYADNSEAFTSKPRDFFYSVDELFDRIGVALNTNVEIETNYDNELGYPTNIAIDDNLYVDGIDFSASLSNANITETLTPEQLITVSGELNYVMLDSDGKNNGYRFTLKPDLGSLIDIWNNSRFQTLLSEKGLRNHGRVKITGYWRGTAYQTGSRFIVTAADNAE